MLLYKKRLGLLKTSFAITAYLLNRYIKCLEINVKVAKRFVSVVLILRGQRLCVFPPEV